MRLTSTAPVIEIRVPEPGLRQDLRAIKVVWRRDLIRFSRDRARIVVSLLQPALFLFVLGTGLAPVTGGGAAAGFDYRTFMFPGVLAMAVMFTSFFSAGSIVWDREFGFLREMLVAPVRRASIVIGKCLGGATVATFQGLVIVALAGLVNVPYDPWLLLTLTAELFLLAFTLTAFGVLVAARMPTMQSFFAVVQMLLMPMFFLSGALFPLSGLPGWLHGLTLVNPLTYAVDPMRTAVFDRLATDVPAVLDPGVMWGGWAVPTAVQLLIVAGLGLIALAAGIARFARAE
jgi:ABC-2 type transport system permease protein